MRALEGRGTLLLLGGRALCAEAQLDAAAIAAATGCDVMMEWANARRERGGGLPAFKGIPYRVKDMGAGDFAPPPTGVHWDQSKTSSRSSSATQASQPGRGDAEVPASPGAGAARGDEVSRTVVWFRRRRAEVPIQNGEPDHHVQQPQRGSHSHSAGATTGGAAAPRASALDGAVLLVLNPKAHLIIALMFTRFLPTRTETDAARVLWTLVPPPRAGPLEDWRPEDPVFWAETGRPVARRNLWISTSCLLLSFAVWMVWSVVVARLPAIGFDFTTSQLFWLAALPGLSGATLRIFCAFLVPIFGGRLWTTLSTASLLVPAFGIGYAVQNPQTPFLIFLVLALLCGFGGGNFASSMANISFFFPKREKGNALAINAGLGNLGVSLMQFLVPVVITFSLFGALGGPAQVAVDGEQIWMQNAGFVWVPLIIAGTVAAWFGMNDILSARASFADQASIFRRAHTWLMCWLYTGTFGTFIGMSAGFPLLSRLVFPEVDELRYAFLGPLVGAISRAATGWISDKYGGARVTFWVFVAQIAAILGMIWFLQIGSFAGFFAMVLALFFASGVGNASTFQMVPDIMRHAVDRAAPGLAPEQRRVQAEREAAAVIGFTSAIAAYGAFYIPRAYGSSIELTGSAEAALWGFLIFYLTCAALTWFVYSGPRGILYESERRGTRPEPTTA